MTSRRVEKAASLLRRLAAEAMVTEYTDYNATATVTSVDVSPDLKNATVMVGVVGREGELLRAVIMKTAASKIAAHVARTAHLRAVPRIAIQIDRGGEYAQHITTLINSTK